MNKKSSMKFSEEDKSNGLALGKALLKVFGIGVAVGAILIGGAKELGDTVLNEENLGSDKNKSTKEKKTEK